MKFKEIKLFESIISVHGKVIYNDGRRRIEVKRPIRDFFDSQDNNKMGFAMEMCLNSKILKQRLDSLCNKNIRPILLYFVTEDSNE